jgi:predicted NBD/HSP70 family sugar kinase
VSQGRSDGMPARHGPAGQGMVRRRNLALALRQIADADEPTSRAGIAAATGLTKATASSLVDELVAVGLVEELPPARRERVGRPAAGLSLARSGPCGLGVEINVDYLAVCAVDLTGEVRARDVVQKDQRDLTPRRALGNAARRVGRMTTSLADEGLTVSGVALALPGLVDTSTGLVHVAPNLGWRDVEVPKLFARDELSALPLSVDNEANYAALCELYAHPASDPQSFLHISGEIGVGAGVVLDGRLYRGLHGWAGEIGHVMLDPDGPMCRCGARGCLEQYAGQEAILAAAGIGSDAATSLGGTFTGDHIAALATEGHAGARDALASAGDALGRTVAAAVNLLDVDTVVLGGLYRPLARWIGPRVEQQVRGRTLAAPWSDVTVRAAALGAEAAMVGAARSVVDALLQDPAAWATRTRSGGGT